MADRVLILRNVPHEGPGLLADVLDDAGVAYDIVDLPSKKPISLDEYATLVMLGGPDSTNDDSPKMKQARAIVEDALKRELPFLGICLGLQILVKVAGGAVVKNDVREAGFRDPAAERFTIELTEKGRKDPLFASLDDTLTVFHLHGETVELTKDMTLLATGEYCVNQVVRVGDCAYGLQCHCELTEDMMLDWIKTDAWLKAMDREALLRDWEVIKTPYTHTGTILLRNFLRIARLG